MWGLISSNPSISKILNASRTGVREVWKRAAVSDILYMRCTLEQSIFRELSKTLNKSQEYKICLLLQKQKELLESDIPLEEMARTFIVYDNEFHYSLYELAGRKNISLFYAAVNSQYERFRTFINLAGKNEGTEPFVLGIDSGIK